VLTEVGCTVTFNIDKHIVKYNGKEILQGEKDTRTDLWILPLGSGMTQMTTQHDSVMPVLACPKMASAHTCLSMQESTNESPTAFFTHTTHSKANSIKFAHQSLCSPRILTLLKAICHGYLKGCPNLTMAGVTRYLNPSTALAKGHMKCPHQGIRIMCPQPPKGMANAPAPAPQLVTPPLLLFQHVPPYPGPAYGVRAVPYPINNTSYVSDLSENADQGPMANIIKDDASAAKSNIFCFGAFAEKQTGTLYNDLTRAFPFM
jgi:hypothetical protein